MRITQLLGCTMYSNGIRRLLFLLIFLRCIPVNAADDIYFYHLGAKDGLSQVNILSIYQDEFGAMWFGSMEGLNRYNGMEMEVFRPEQHAKGLTQNTIYKMSGNKAGAIYLQSGQDLIRYDTYTQHFEIVHQGGVRAIAYEHDTLWAIIDNKVMQYDEQTKQLKEYVILDKNITGISCMFPAKDGSIWIGSNSGLFSISGKNLREQKNVTSKIRIDCIYQDKSDNIWVGTFNNGVFVIDIQGNIVNYRHQDDMNSLSNDQIRSFVEDNSGKMWIATFYGLNVFDPKTGKWSRYVNDDNISHTLSHSSVFSLYKDEQGTIWAGTYFGGINYFNPESDIFTFYEANSTNLEHLSFPYVGEMTEDKHGNLWICTEGGTLNCLNMKKRRFSRYSFHHPSNSTPPATSFNQKSIWYNAEKDFLYVAIHNVGLAVLNLKTKSIHIHKNDGTPGALPNRTINKMQFHEHVLYLMTQSGLVKMDLDTERFYPVSKDPNIIAASSGIKVNTFLIDSKSRLWVPISNGVRSIDLKSGEIKTFLYDEANERSICRLDINNIFETGKGELFFASAGAGIFRYDPVSEDFDNYTREKNNLESNYCYHISEAPSGKLILLHNKSFSFFNSKKPDEYTFSSSPGFPIVGFNVGNSSYITNNGEIFIGGINGLVSFGENDLYKINKPYTLYFDKLFVNNEQVYPNDKFDILKETLPLCSRINLKYSQKNITVKFASSNYLQTKTHNYEYKLEGFDRDWIPTKTKIISYTNLNIGAYTLLIRETQKSVNGNQTVYSLVINVKPPFYLTTIAFIVYGILIVLIIIGISRFWLWRTKMQTTLEFERKDKERIEELNRTKLRFFTNVSHEFRTPLTLIMGQVESLLMQNDLSPKVHNKLIKTHKNTKHLLSLVSELLDFRKQEQGFYKLNIKHVELISYLEEIYDSFRDYATKSKIKYRFEHAEKEIHMYIDPVHLQKAIYNLLSNAFKYTSPNGKITLQVKLRESDVSIRIIDDGIGIPPESLNKIFEWFYQLEYRSSGLTLGTGIGLALTQEIVTAHKGEISVESTLNEGSVFTITLKLGTSHFSKEELSYKDSGTDIAAIRTVMTDFEYQYPETTDNNTGTDETKPVVLIIDDNEPLLDMLTESFSSYYNVHTTLNGKDGLDMVSGIQPDLILCDVMMPGISGKKVCYLVKNNALTSHIPVVLLTAQSSDNEMMEGYMFGADAYFIKPFNIKVLITYCNNLIKNRRLLYQKYVDMKEEVTPVSAIEQNQELMDKVIMTIKKNFNSSEFDMNKLGMELGMGRSKLYTKIKEITGFTPNELTLNLKMQEAAHLLDTKLQMNISEIAFELGFSSTKYFTKCFKSFYNTVPQDWRRRNADHPKT